MKTDDKKSKMNILMVGNHFNDSRHNINAWQELADQLSMRGHLIFTASGKNDKFLRMADMLHTIWRKRACFQVAEVDVFSGQAFFWALMSGKLLGFLHKPFVLTLHGGNLPEFSKKYPNMVSSLLSTASAVTAPSEYLVEKMKFYREDIRLIPNGINLARYPFIERTTPKPTLVWLRAFHKIYNPQMAVEVLALLTKNFSDAKLSMTGPDKGDQTLHITKKISVDLNVDKAVQFTGKVPKSEVVKQLNAGDIFINTTDFDNTPISVIEAMACGMCVVSTNVGGIPYLLEDGIDALLVPARDSEAMANAVSRVLTEPGLAHRLSTNARRKAEQFDWSLILSKWQELLNGLGA